MFVLVRFFSFLTCFLILTHSFAAFSYSKQVKTEFHTVTSVGKWILEQDGTLMADPQTSGLTYSDGYLYSISDASAKPHQLRKLHKMLAGSGQIIEKVGPIHLLKNIAENSCFASYLSDRPDYEGLVAIPNSKTEWLVVTEDASRGNKISPQCLVKYAAANFTHYPSLIVKLELIENKLMLTGVRVLQFSSTDRVDKRINGAKAIENDGIEGITITREGKILLALEKDANEKPRVFELDFDKELFSELDTFVKVYDSGLIFPDLMTQKSPINGMDVYYPNENSSGFLVTAARNVNQLWILDLSKQKTAIIIDLNLYAPSDNSMGCELIHKIGNTSLEGVAVHNGSIFLINDPWKKNYKKNIICAQDKVNYEGMSPLIFSFPINAGWFE